MTEEQENRNPTDVGGIVVAVIMIIVGAIAIWDTTNMSDSDSYVFPRAIAGAMMLLSVIFIAKQLIAPSIGENSEAGLIGGSHLRRIGLVIAMIGSALIMPWVGFMVSGILVFACIMLLAMYDEWTPKLRIVFPVVGLVIVIGFYFMFAELLSVPLPTGSLFD